MSSFVKTLLLLTLCSFITNCSLWQKSEEDQQAEMARFQDYYPSDVYKDIEGEERSPSSNDKYEDDNYAAADDDSANQDDEQNAYLDQQLDKDEDMDKGTDPLAANDQEEESEVADIADEAPAAVPTGTAFKNGMHKFNADCAMKAKPDSGSKNVGSVSAGKKLWVENHNAQWAKVYKKSGAVYVSKSCL